MSGLRPSAPLEAVCTRLLPNAPVGEPPPKTTTEQPLATTVRIQEVMPQAVQLTVNSQGTVAPSTETELIPEVSGRVTWISPALVNGGFFNEGDALCVHGGKT